jgi:hypothetical protein
VKINPSSKDSAMLHRQALTCVRAFVALGTLATLGACADSNTVAPTTEEQVFHAPANFTQVGTSVVFRVDNSDGVTQEIGEHILYVQPGAICDLSSSYGPTTWDSDCKPLRGSVTITATVFSGPNGQPYVDFQPAMRFSPRKQAYLFLRTDRANSETQMQRLLINYCNALGNCVDDSLTDASLKPFALDQYGVVGRRVKHFSGYVVAYEQCAGCTNNDMLLRRSGYMVASGEDVVDELVKSGVFDKDRQH